MPTRGGLEGWAAWCILAPDPSPEDELRGRMWYLHHRIAEFDKRFLQDPKIEMRKLLIKMGIPEDSALGAFMSPERKDSP